jgi:integrase
MIRQLALRERVQPAGKISHENVFFRQDGSPIRNLMTPYDCRRWTLKGLKSRYRPPYNARQSWVSWLLMIGKNLLWVANNHRHSVPTMPTDYAAWIEGVAKDADIDAIKRGDGIASVRVHGRARSLRPLCSPKVPRICQ